MGKSAAGSGSAASTGDAVLGTTLDAGLDTALGTAVDAALPHDEQGDTAGKASTPGEVDLEVPGLALLGMLARADEIPPALPPMVAVTKTIVAKATQAAQPVHINDDNTDNDDNGDVVAASASPTGVAIRPGVSAPQDFSALS